MRSAARVFAALVLFVAAIALPVTSRAAVALRAPVPGQVLLGFGESYGASKVHSGLDMAAGTGDPVRAPVAGTVTFAGRLPSAEGGALGVTITTPDGFKVTCLPLSGLDVSKGDAVETGDGIGLLAGTGDASSSGSHVHLSLREGESYLDPAKTMTPPEEAAPAPEPVQSPEPSPAGRADAPAALAAAAGPAPCAAAVAGGVDAGAVPAQAVPGSSGVAEQPFRASSAVDAVSACASALRASPAPPPLRTVAHTSGIPSLDTALRLYERLQGVITALAALLVSAACLWPVWRRVSMPVVASEVAPARVRS